MATYYVIETRRDEDDEWSEDHIPGKNCFKTDDDAWSFVGELRGALEDVSEYRVAIYAGPQDDERLWGYAL